MSKILKNTTVSPISIIDTGIRIAASGSYTIPETDYLLWAASANVLTQIASGAIVVNDGLRDLSATDGAYFIKYPDTAFNQRFLCDPDRINGFTKRNNQEAIEEARNTAQGKVRYMASCGFDGTASSGRYLEFNSNVDSNQSGLVLALPSILKELSVCIASSGTVTFVVYTWGGSTETQIATISISASRKAVVTGLSVSLASLTELRVKTTSGSGSRPIFNLLFQVS
jgi:hypothetical protein